MSLQAVAGKISPPEAAERVHAAVDRLDTTIRDLRTTIFGLQSRPDWGHDRLRGVVLRLAFEAGRSLGFEPAVRFSGDVEAVDDEVAEQLPPTLGEALSNAVRHAHAVHVDVDLRVDDDAVTLRVIDDGVGGAPDPDDAEGDGLRNLRARAEALGGTCSVTPGAGGTGTVVEWRVPNRRG
jgi:signal transduction histidine kinase